MKRVLPIFFLFLIFFQVAWAANSVSTSDFWRYLSQLKSYQADFEQHTYTQDGSLKESGSGNMALLRPGYFRWETLKPVHQILIADHSTYWLYDVDLAQASKQSLANQGTINPAALLSGSTEEAREQFIVSSAKSVNNQNCFTLTPKEGESTVKDMELCFDQTILKSMTINQAFGERTDFIFKKIKYNQSVSKKLFQFSPPEGVDVLEN